MMRRNAKVSVHVTDHAIARYLEREFGLDIGAIRRHLTGKALCAAQLGAIAVQTGKVKLMLVKNEGDKDVVTIVTVMPRNAEISRMDNNEQD